MFISKVVSRLARKMSVKIHEISWVRKKIGAGWEQEKQEDFNGLKKKMAFKKCRRISGRGLFKAIWLMLLFLHEKWRKNQSSRF